jgi:hypothetical protein
MCPINTEFIELLQLKTKANIHSWNNTIKAFKILREFNKYRKVILEEINKLPIELQHKIFKEEWKHRNDMVMKELNMLSSYSKSGIDTGSMELITWQKIADALPIAEISDRYIIKELFVIL